MRPGRGLVLEIKKRSCVVVTGDGQFLEVPRPCSDLVLGQELVFNRSVRPGFKSVYLAVASVMVVVLAWFVFNSTLPRAVAYVALDINPSLELGINSGGEIISARGVNDDGKELLKKVTVVNEPLAEGVQKIIAGCITYQYLNSGQENLVLATVTDVVPKKSDKESTASINEVHDCVYNSINSSIDEAGVRAKLIVADTNLETMKKARDSGVTPGRYILQKEALKKGVQITDRELREEPIRELEVQKNFRIGDLMQKEINNGLSDKPDKFGKTGKPAKKSNSDDHNKPASFSPEKFDDSQNNRVGRNVTRDNENDKESTNNARGKSPVFRDNGDFSKRQLFHRDKELQKKDNPKQKETNRYERDDTVWKFNRDKHKDKGKDNDRYKNN
ncbi:anti-sigma factor domain-containing protein [Desulfoscipio sp. XC116]|uniref:anti-sigma factor domain-containing protein n=1 Tax=Desulfoscipio sp. XC116 TaxID=3144975 RepID=UPI00325AEA4F